MTAFILGRTIKSLTHAAVIEYPELLSNGQLEQEITALRLAYLQNPPSTELAIKLTRRPFI